MNGKGIALCQKKGFVPGFMGMVVNLIYVIQYRIVDKAELSWIPSEPRCHISVSARVYQSFQKNAQPYHSSTGCSLLADNFVRNLQTLHQ